MDSLSPPLSPQEKEKAFPEPLGEQRADELQRLRALLFQRELGQLRDLEARLNDPVLRAKDISRVLAEAIALRSGKDERLSRALQPTVERIFRSSVRRNPGDFTTTLFPFMGPAIRKSIAETFHSMLQSLNKALEMAFSWKGLRWRLEALRSGKPFAEVVLLHTLVYRVEQVFCIHAETGLLLGHVSNEGVEFQDADLVSGMLTVVQDFVKDCFAQRGEEALDTLQMGERTLMVEKGIRLVLACVVRGTPPAAFRGTLRDTREMIELEAAELLEDFKGDTIPFAPLFRYLDDCLVSRYVDENAPLPWPVKCLPTLLLLFVLGAGGFIWWQERAFSHALAELRRTPGIVVTEVAGGYIKGWRVTALRDPLSRNPAEILDKEDIPGLKYSLVLVPFASLEPDMVADRLRRALDAPDSAHLRFEDGTLYLEGSASLGWILATTDKALALPGVERVDSAQIRDPRTERLRRLMDAVESTRVEFPLGKDMPVPEEREKLTAAVDKLAELAALSNQMDLSATLIIYGHTDPTGTEKRNYELSEARATTLASMLYSRGVAMPITTYGFGAQHAVKQDRGNEGEDKASRQRSRRIELKVRLTFLGKSLMSF